MSTSHGYVNIAFNINQQIILNFLLRYVSLTSQIVEFPVTQTSATPAKLK